MAAVSKGRMDSEGGGFNLAAMQKDLYINVVPFLKDIDFTKKGLYKTLDEDYGIKFNKAIETFKATQLNAYECKLLNCPKNQYGLLVKRVSYSKDRIICCSSIVSKGDIFEFSVVLGE